MGHVRYDAKAWDDYATSSFGATRDALYKSVDRSAVFKGRGIHADLDPKNMKNMMRESRDGANNPRSRAIILALDETGSMGDIPHFMVGSGLPKVFEEIEARNPVSDPHIMVMGIGDVESDKAPIQMSQFEAGKDILPQLANIFLEGNGGGNHYESYALAWYMAANHTSIDCFEKRGEKGYLFTIGDEFPTPLLRADDIRKFVGTGPQEDLTSEQILNMANRMYHVFHIIVGQGQAYRRRPDETRKRWSNLMGQNAIPLSDKSALSEVIVSTMQANKGLS